MGQSIQSIQRSLYLILPAQQLHEFPCDTLSTHNIYLAVHLLIRPCFICFVVKASTESNSTIILTMIFVTIGVGWIVVYTSRRSRKFPRDSKRLRRAS